ncbi:MAG: porin family protein [Deltaproteobacteria bacterium]|nr:porin family protein [Deltaproteobacteria bacterium]
MTLFKLGMVTAAFFLVLPARGAEQAEKWKGWQMPSPEEQDERDPTLIPVGKGAIFVPAMSNSAAEPYYLVYKNNELISEQPMGNKTILPPGNYVVRVGSGVLDQMMRFNVKVVEGRSTILKPVWAGLKVRVVDKRNSPFRGSYELIHLPDNQDFGMGLGADFRRGEILRTWLLPPGLYMLVKTGENYRARTNFLTVRLLPGELVHFTLVEETGEDDASRIGDFLGGGVVSRGEAETAVQNWKLGLLIGGNFAFDRADHVPGREFGNTLNLGLYLDGTVRYNLEGHELYLRLEAEHARQKRPNGDFDPRTDQVDLDAVYTYRIVPWFGPYVRVGYDGQLFPSYIDYGKRRSVQYFKGVNDPESGVVTLQKTRIADAFGKSELEEGGGLSFDISPSYIFSLDLRIGYGALQVLTRGLYREVGCSDVLKATSSETSPCAGPDAADVSYLLKVPNSYRMGPEASLIGIGRMTRWISLTTEFKLLEPIEDWSSPIMKWQLTVSFRLVSFASLNYIVDLAYDKKLEDMLQIRQRLLLRFSYEIL